MVLTPPSCPQCPDGPMLWKDTTRMRPDVPDSWSWYCTGCKGYWRPSAEHVEVYPYGTPAGSQSAVRTAAS
jgi:hypothetical protein